MHLFRRALPLILVLIVACLAPGTASAASRMVSKRVHVTYRSVPSAVLPVFGCAGVVALAVR